MKTPAVPPTRRTVLTAAAWSVPAITIASAAPAFASSIEAAIPGATCSLIAMYREWSVTAGDIDNPVDSRSTGWLDANRYGETDFVTANQARWFDGHEESAQTGGASTQPTGSFLSFANNSSTSGSTTLLVRYAFVVEGNATVRLSGKLGLGYGDSGTSPQQTERQLVDITVRDGQGPILDVAKIAHRRAEGSNYYPAGSQGAYGSLTQSDPVVAGAGYTLHTANPGHHDYFAEYESGDLYFPGDSDEPREISVLYTLALHRRPGAGWVSDDVIIQPPVAVVNC